MITDSQFIRILYSTPDIVFNGVHILIPIKITNIDKQFNKNVVYYEVEANKELIESIINIEKGILEKYNIKNKECLFNLKNQIETGTFKLYPEINEKKRNFDIILKISGLWENTKNYGLTYKFISL